MAALEIDNAVTLRLLTWDNKKEHDNRAFWVQLVTGERLDDDDVLNASELHPLIANDPYADENTVIS